MEAAGMFEGREDRDIPMKYSDRSKTPIEPYMSDQWFVAMDKLGQLAMDAVTDCRVKITPARYAKTYLDWLGEKRDWCISRQLWWGHRIPVWKIPDAVRSGESGYDLKGTRSWLKELAATNPDRIAVQWSASLAPPMDGVEPRDIGTLVCLGPDTADIQAELERRGFEQDPDVLDTWFSSALWPHATLGWPDREHNPPLNNQPDLHLTGHNEVLDYFYPGSVLITSRDIITLWVARMVIMGLYNMGDVPFRHVHVHPKILDGFGQTMSKSKGNGVDPMDLIDKYGVDAIRFTITSFAGENQDVRLPVGYECPHCGEVIPQTLEHQKAIPAGGDKPRVKCPKCKKPSQYSSPWFAPDDGEPVARVVSERFEYGRNFCNKLWNASRFAIMNLEGYTPGSIAESDLLLEDRWILSRLATTAKIINTELGEYRFDAATRALRDFTWNEFCDWYVEMLKPRLRDLDRRPAAQRLLVGVLDALLRLLSPFTPFLCEEIWQRLGEIAPARGLLEPLPAANCCMIAPWPVLPDAWRDSSLESRFARLQEIIAAVRNVRAMYRIEDKVELALHVRCQPEVASQLTDVAGQFANLARTVLMAAGVDVSRPGTSASFSLADADGFIPLEGVVDR
jgi:valyl-tRNA synthetase